MPSATSSDYLHHARMKHLLWGDAWATISNIYVALFTTVPNLDGTGGAEVPANTDTAYARQQVAVSNTEWDVNGLEYSNANDIVFPAPNTTSWGQINGAGLYDAATGGNLLYVASLTTPKQVSVGDGSPKILANQLRITRATC